MSDVTFNEEPHYARRSPEEATPGSIIGFMYKLGIAKTKGDANMIMGGVILVCAVVSATLLVFMQPHTDPQQAAALQHDVELMNAQTQTHYPHP